MQGQNMRQSKLALVLFEPLVSTLVLSILMYPWTRPRDVPAMIWIVSMFLGLNMVAVCLRTYAGRTAAFLCNPLFAGLVSGVVATVVLLWPHGGDGGFEIVAPVAIGLSTVIAIGSYGLVSILRNTVAAASPLVARILACIAGAILIGVVTLKVVSH